MSKPLVSIISVNYNEPEETKLFLDSLYKSDYQHFETIIVDNSSKRKISKDLENKYPNLTCILHDENLGFAGGNNLGINIAKGSYLVFLNNDTLVPKDFLNTMVSFMKAHPLVGMASPKVIYPNGIIQYGGARDIHPLTGRGKRIGLYEKDIGQFDHIHETGLPHGAAMIVSKDAIDQIGGMPEEYFLYYEEHDWCKHLKKSGFKMYYVGTTHIVHKESISVGEDSPLKVYYMNRNRILFHFRNFSGLNLISGLMFYSIFALSKTTLIYLLQGKLKHLKSLWRGVLWHFNKNYVFKP
ncbi:MAG: glycosyltransferase family 2 protein [Reichenbachiella sp.]